jgi:hypothetical protein
MKINVPGFYVAQSVKERATKRKRVGMYRTTPSLSG